MIFKSHTSEKQRWSVFECCRTRKGVLEQGFRAPSGFAARPRSGFERPVAAEHGRAVVSSAKQALGGVFECRIPGLNSFRFPNRAEDLLYNITFKKSPLESRNGKTCSHSAALQNTAHAQYLCQLGLRKLRKLEKTKKTRENQENSRKLRKRDKTQGKLARARKSRKLKKTGTTQDKPFS